MMTPIFLAMLSDLLYNLFRAAHSVRRGGENAAGVAGALAAGIEPAQSGLIGVVAHDAHGGAGARLDRGEHRVGRGSASSSAAQTNGGKQSCRSHQRTAGR